jgi:Family of unknown function (DUF6941)
MELDFAMLADAAQVTQGKTYILGGGVTILWRGQFPASLGVSLVVQFTYHRSEAPSEHDIRVQVVDADGNPVLPEIEGKIGIGPPAEHIPRNVPLAATFVLPLPPVPVLQRPGAYAVEVLLDDRHVKSLAFAVANPPAQPLS